MTTLISLLPMQLQQTVQFKLYNPARYFSDLIKIRIENAFLQKQSLTSKVKPIKLLITSDNRSYTSEQQFSPFLAYRKQLRQKLGLALNQMLLKDVLSLPGFFVRSYDIIFLKLDFRTPADEAEQIIQQFYKIKGNSKLVYFDGDDDACIQWPKVLKYVDLYVKKSLLVDFDQYQQVFIGKNNLTDYVSHKWGVSFSDNIIPESTPVDPIYFNKIILGYNIALDDKIRELYQKNLNTQRMAKDNDILCRATIPNNWMGYLRKEITPELQKMASKYRVLIPDQRVTQEQYYDELRCSKICVSPFGYGEICWRDFESILCQCLLIKPDMSHIKTEPNVFVPYETYIPVKWDLSDLQEKCSYYLEHEDERKRIIAQAYKVLSDYYHDEKFISKFEGLLSKLEIQCNNTAS